MEDLQSRLLRPAVSAAVAGVTIPPLLWGGYSESRPAFGMNVPSPVLAGALGFSAAIVNDIVYSMWSFDGPSALEDTTSFIQHMVTAGAVWPILLKVANFDYTFQSDAVARLAFQGAAVEGVSWYLYEMARESQIF